MSDLVTDVGEIKGKLADVEKITSYVTTRTEYLLHDLSDAARFPSYAGLSPREQRKLGRFLAMCPVRLEDSEILPVLKVFSDYLDEAVVAQARSLTSFSTGNDSTDGPSHARMAMRHQLEYILGHERAARLR